MRYNIWLAIIVLDFKGIDPIIIQQTSLHIKLSDKDTLGLIIQIAFQKKCHPLSR
jgi:hypothetical protein